MIQDGGCCFCWYCSEVSQSTSSQLWLWYVPPLAHTPAQLLLGMPVLLALTPKVIPPFPPLKYHRPGINYFQPYRHPVSGSYWEHIPLNSQAAAAPPSAADLASEALLHSRGAALMPTQLQEGILLLPDSTRQSNSPKHTVTSRVWEDLCNPSFSWRMKTETWGNLKKKKQPHLNPTTTTKKITTSHNNQPPFTFLPCEILHGMSCLTHLWER